MSVETATGNSKEGADFFQEGDIMRVLNNVTGTGTTTQMQMGTVMVQTGRDLREAVSNNCQIKLRQPSDKALSTNMRIESIRLCAFFRKDGGLKPIDDGKLRPLSGKDGFCPVIDGKQPVVDKRHISKVMRLPHTPVL